MFDRVHLAGCVSVVISVCLASPVEVLDLLLAVIVHIVHLVFGLVQESISVSGTLVYYLQKVVVGSKFEKNLSRQLKL